MIAKKRQKIQAMLKRLYVSDTSSPARVLLTMTKMMINDIANAGKWIPNASFGRGPEDDFEHQSSDNATAKYRKTFSGIPLSPSKQRILKEDTQSISAMDQS